MKYLLRIFHWVSLPKTIQNEDQCLILCKILEMDKKGLRINIYYNNERRNLKNPGVGGKGGPWIELVCAVKLLKGGPGSFICC